MGEHHDALPQKIHAAAVLIEKKSGFFPENMIRCRKYWRLRQTLYGAAFFENTLRASGKERGDPADVSVSAGLCGRKGAALCGNGRRMLFSRKRRERYHDL